jgi:nucleotide-binding universal stress UspA family protein
VAAALSVARAADARATVLHVTGGLTSRETPRTILAKLFALVAPHQNALSLQCALAEGEPAQEILAFAATHGVDLVALGSRRRGALSRAILESTTDTVSGEARGSVLTIGHDGAEPAPTPRLRRITCAVDLTDTSIATLDAAASLAVSVGGRLTVVHVVDPATEWPHPHPASPHDVEEARAVLDRVAGERLSALVLRRWTPGFDIEPLVLFGSPGEQIAETAAAVGADLLIVGAHRHRRLGRARLGSTAEYLRRRGPCPVLLARPSVPSAHALEEDHAVAACR